ncbi:MAG: peptide chain release factor N(5)-glutamine methyltransferase [Lachnospiraceae bacterium]|nr:peptide chain release factor N(5)-glutamine methyltransferase [Lachnospiraceae bacterium]
MNLREALGRAEERLTRADITDAKTDAWLLLQHVTGITRAAYFMSPETELPYETEKRFFRLVEERATRRPLQYITGTQDFMGLTFWVNEHVLIPRQDTEILVEKAIGILKEAFSGEERHMSGTSGKESECGGKKLTKILSEESLSGGSRAAEKTNFQILDLGTGSGCIAVSLAAWCVRNSWPAEVMATDISAEALLVARANAETILAKELCEKSRKSEDKAGMIVTETGDEAEAGTKAAETGDEAEAGTAAVKMGDSAEAETVTESLKNIIRFGQGDLFEATGREKFSLILSNPPYIRSEDIETLMPEVRDFEPRLALDGAGDGLALYRRIAAEAPAHLEQGGRLLLEIGCDEADAVRELLAENGFCDIQVLKDYAGLDRVVYGIYEMRLVEGM